MLNLFILTPLDINAWLAGFSDGDGSFDIRISDTTGRVDTCFELVQSRINHELAIKYLPIIESIAAFILTKLTISLVTNASGSISKRLRARTTTRSGSGIIALYFTIFPLLSSKWNNFIGWRSVYSRILLRKTKSEQDLQAIKNLKNSHNSRRTLINWDHLTKFYRR